MILRMSSVLTSLTLSGNLIANRDLQVIMEALGTNNTLTNLIICDGNDEVVKAIAEMLKLNSTLNNLNFSGLSHIGDAGAKEIAEALKINRVLTRLSLNGNIGNEGAIAIAEALRVNNVLTYIELYGYAIDEAGQRAVIERLVDNVTLQEMHMVFSEVNQRIIELVLKRNSLVAHCIKEIRRLNMFNMLNGLHPRVGTNSPIQLINTYLLQNVFRHYLREEVPVEGTETNFIMRGSIEQIRNLPLEILREINEIRHIQMQLLDLLHAPIPVDMRLLELEPTRAVTERPAFHIDEGPQIELHQSAQDEYVLSPPMIHGYNFGISFPN
jgi:hypothetical protein